MKPLYWLIVFGLMEITFGYAQNTRKIDKEIKLLLDEVVVTATGTNNTLKNVPIETEIISRKQIDSYSGSSLEELLSGISASFDFNESDMGSNMQLNGLGNSYILILIDGKKMSGDVGGQTALGRINMNNIDHIEIVKGASSALYGSDAIAGVINIITKKTAQNGYLIDNTSRLASFGSFQQSNTVGYKTNKCAGNINYQYKHHDGWQNTSIEDERQTEELITDSRNKTVNRNTEWLYGGDFTFNPGSRFEIYAQGNYYQKHIYRPSGKYASVDVKLYDLAYKNSSMTTGFKWYLRNSNTISLDCNWNIHKYFYYYTARTFEDIPGQALPYPYYPGDWALQSDQQRMLANLKGIFNWSPANRLSLGIESNYDWLKSPHRLENNGHVTNETLAGYAQNEWNPNNFWNVTIGFRIINNSSFGWKATPKISVMYKIGSVNVRTTYSSGFKTPTLKELKYCYVRDMNGVYLYLGNDNLKPQTSNYFSLGTEYNGNKLSTSVTGYYNSVDKMIALTTINNTDYNKLSDYVQGKILAYDPVKVRLYNNMEDAKTYGVDFSFTYRITPYFNMGCKYSYLDTKAHVLCVDKHNGEYLKEVVIDGMAHHRATANMSWSHTWNTSYKTTIALFGRMQSKRYYQLNGNGKAYQLWKLNTVHDIGKSKYFDIKLNVGVDNIFNYYERTPHGLNYGTTTPGRTYYASFAICFKKGKTSKILNKTLKDNDYEKD